MYDLVSDGGASVASRVSRFAADTPATHASGGAYSMAYTISAYSADYDLSGGGGGDGDASYSYAVDRAPARAGAAYIEKLIGRAKQLAGADAYVNCTRLDFAYCARASCTKLARGSGAHAPNGASARTSAPRPLGGALTAASDRFSAAAAAADSALSLSLIHI